MFVLESFRKWLQNRRIPLSRCNSHFVVSDLRKFAEQHGDVVGWNESNRAYILTHGVRGIEGVSIAIRCLSTFLMFICSIGGMSNSHGVMTKDFSTPKMGKYLITNVSS